MASAQHRTPEHRAAYAAIKRAQAAGRWLVCHQPVCKFETRDIAPWQPAHVCHDDSGTVILGPGHSYCNEHEAGKKRHRVARRVNSWVM